MDGQERRLDRREGIGVSNFPSIIPEDQVQIGVGEGGAPVFVSRQIALVQILHTRYITEGGDIRPVLALYGYKRYAAFLGEGHRLLSELAQELLPSNESGLRAMPTAHGMEGEPVE